MSDTLRVLAFAGSARRDSFNRRLLGIAAEGARRAGAEVTVLEMRDHVMPLYDQDLEAGGIPATASAFRRLLLEHQAFLIACPEYNSSITPLLKNAIDWATRSAPGQASLQAFTGKVAALMAASPGALGGGRGLVTVRSILGNIGMLVLPSQVTVAHANAAFDTDGRLKDARQQAAAETLGETLVSYAQRLARPA